MLPAGKQINHVLTVSMTKISPFSKASKRALGPNQPTYRTETGKLFAEDEAAVP
jgi:hypothetical protein